MKIDNYLTGLKNKKEKLDIVLIHADSFYNSKYSYFNMGLLYMATILKEQGYKVRCLGADELYSMAHSDIRRIFTMEHPAVAGFYTLSDNIYQVEEFAANIKRWSPQTTVVTGGPLATSIREKILNHPAIDFSVIGEGEEAIQRIAGWKIKKSCNLEDIPGLIYRSEGGFKSNPPSLPIENLDMLPIPDKSFVGGKRNFHLVSGRGCPYNCIFCFQGVHGLKYRYRSAENIVDEIKFNIEKYNSSGFDIIDDTFIANPQRVKKVAGLLQEYRKESDKEFIFFCQGRVDIMDKHPEMLEELKKAGLVRVQIGLESGSQNTLDIYDKKITTDQIKRVVKNAAELGGLCVAGNFILGGPFENEETFNKTLSLTKELLSIAPGCFEMGFSFLGPYPGTKIASNPEKYGLKTIDEEFKKGLTLSEPHMLTESFDLNDLRQLNIKYYNEITAHMEKLLPEIPWELVLTHFHWARIYGLMSLWYLWFLSRRDTLSDYYDAIMSPRFLRLDLIPRESFLEWYPQRTREVKNYSEDGSELILPQTTGNYTLSDPNEILVYELSSGKLTVDRMLDEFIKETKTEKTKQEILNNIFIPTFRKLERTFHMTFYR